MLQAYAPRFTTRLARLALRLRDPAEFRRLIRDVGGLWPAAHRLRRPTGWVQRHARKEQRTDDTAPPLWALVQLRQMRHERRHPRPGDAVLLARGFSGDGAAGDVPSAPRVAKPKPAAKRSDEGAGAPAVHASPAKPRVLLLGGSLNQTTIMHQVGRALGPRFACTYAPFYADGWLRYASEAGLLDFTILGGQARKATVDYLEKNRLPVDVRGSKGPYDLVVLGTDLFVPKNVRASRIVLVQEGMMDPEGFVYHAVRKLGLPRYLANTAMTGQSGRYDRFCVAGEGWKDVAARKGADPSKITVTGIPNFDDCRAYLDNDFPHHGYVLAATSSLRETLKYEDRKAFIRDAVRIANGRPLFFKLHPNENHERATKEVHRYAPGARVFATGNTNHMIANCDALITRYSSVLLVAAALGKELHSDVPKEHLDRLTPLQNGGTSAQRIAEVCGRVLQEKA
jgi:hypothetical protein